MVFNSILDLQELSLCSVIGEFLLRPLVVLLFILSQIRILLNSRWKNSVGSSD